MEDTEARQQPVTKGNVDLHDSVRNPNTQVKLLQQTTTLTTIHAIRLALLHAQFPMNARQQVPDAGGTIPTTGPLLRQWPGYIKAVADEEPKVKADPRRGEWW